MAEEDTLARIFGRDPAILARPQPPAPTPTTEAKRLSRSGSQTRQKLHMVTTGYSADEFAALTEAASRAGLTKASFQRVQSLATPKTRSTRKPPIERELLAKAVGQLGKVGSNLNQIARAANMGERLAIDGALHELREILPLLLKALERKA